MATDHFHHSSQWQVIICKECRYAVWPSQVIGHLVNKQHGMSRKRATQISEEVQEWPGVVQFPSEFKVPKDVKAAVDELAVFEDGVKCQLEGGQCLYVCRSVDNMKTHWRKAHRFSAGQGRGRAGRLKKEDMERRVLENCRRVWCQRFFVQGEHSQYFEIQSDVEAEGVSVAGDAEEQAWSQA
jgi:uncharacterized C2H2 Zn-finger protein